MTQMPIRATRTAATKPEEELPLARPTARKTPAKTAAKKAAPKSAKPAAKAQAASKDSGAEAARPGKSLTDIILGRLDEDKAQDVVLIDVQGKSSVADAIVVASGRSARHVGALADHLLRALKTAGYGKARVEGLPQADWVLIDAGDAIVHLFRPEVRAYYNIEKIWSVDTPSGHLRDSAG